MTIAIFGATGLLGGHVIDQLLERGVPAADILALGRNTERLAELAGRGIRTAAVNLDDVDGTAEALSGVDKTLARHLAECWPDRSRGAAHVPAGEGSPSSSVSRNLSVSNR